MVYFLSSDSIGFIKKLGFFLKGEGVGCESVGGFVLRPCPHLHLQLQRQELDVRILFGLTVSPRK